MQIDHFLDFHRSAQMSGGAWTGDDRSITSSSSGTWGAGEAAPPMPREAVVMGDFNSMLESEEYVRMVGGIDPCYGRVGHLDSFVDSWEVARDHTNDRTTWFPDSERLSPGDMTLDYCFVTPDSAQSIRRAWVDKTADGSDHLPYWIEMDY